MKIAPWTKITMTPTKGVANTLTQVVTTVRLVLYRITVTSSPYLNIPGVQKKMFKYEQLKD